MDKLLALIDEIGKDEEDDTVIGLSSVTMSGTALDIQLAITTYHLVVETRYIQVRCEDVFAYSLKDEGASRLELTGNHPLLWKFTHDSASAFFTGKPDSAFAAIGALYEAHRYAVSDWFGLEAHLNGGIDLRKLLSEGNGLLALGPVPLLTVYKNALKPYGVEVEILNPGPPGGRMTSPESQHRLRHESRALLMGESYIIGVGWTAP